MIGSSGKTVDERFWEKVDKTGDCWLWKGSLTGYGYGDFCLIPRWKNTKMIRAHRYSYAIHYGEIPSGLCVCHKCDVRNCVRPDHLFLGTIQDNTADMIKKKRHHVGKKKYSEKFKRGESHYKALLNRGIVEEVVSLSHECRNKSEIARMLGIGRHLVGNILAGKSWRHVTSDLHMAEL